MKTLYAVTRWPVVGGFNAVFFSSLIFVLAAFASFFACCSGVNTFFTGFFGAAFFFFALAEALRAWTRFLASPPSADRASRLTARFTGRDGSPTAVLGRPGVA